MFRYTWKKYLPVIAILIKRSVQEEQALTLNQLDFERAAGGKKTKFSFPSVKLYKGRMDTDRNHSPFVKEFAVALLEDETTEPLIRKNHLEFSMNTNFELKIKNLPLESEEEDDEESVAEEKTDEKS